MNNLKENLRQAEEEGMERGEINLHREIERELYFFFNFSTINSPLFTSVETSGSDGRFI